MKDERLGLVDIINVYEQTKRLSLIGINDSSKPLHPSHSLFRLNNSSLEKVSKIGNISIDDDDSSDDNDEDIDQEQHLVSNSFIQGSTAILCSQHLTSIVHDHEESSVLENESITDYLDYIHHKTMLIQNNNSNNTVSGVINGNNNSDIIIASTNSSGISMNNNPDTSLSDNNCLKLNDISSKFVIENDIREYISSNLYKITYLLHHSTQMTESEMLEMIQLIESYLFYSNNNNNNNNTSTTSPSNNSNNGNTTINSNNIHNNTHNNCNNSTIDFKKDLIDSKTKCSLLHTASKFDFLTVMQYLLDKQPDLLESKDRSDATPIFYACSSAHSKSVTMLAINGAILNTHDKYEASPLSVSLNSINKSKGFTVARTLLGFHVDIEYKVYCGNTILHLACREGDLEKVQFIVEDLKHNIFRKNTKQESCLFRAVKHEKITKYLIDFCENTIGREKLLKLLFMKNDKGQTVVHHCCSKGYMESLVHIVKCLARDSDKLELLFNEKDSVYGLTPLHVTVLAEQEEIFELLIRSKEIQLDVINKVGDTPLHIAVRNEKLAMIKELYHLYPSKSLQIKNNQKKTIDKLAKERDIDLKKLEKELEQDNAGIQKEGFWSSIFGNKKKKTKFSPSNSSSELQSRMSNMSRRNSLLVSVSWDPTKYAVGCDQIDSQHAQLIEWLKNLSEASLTSQSHWVVGYTIGCLIEYTEFHFSDEEQLLSKYKKGIGEEYVKKHHEEHLTFTTKMKNMQKDYLKSHATSLDIELLNYLINWLVKHINYTDRKLADYINTHKPDDEE